LETNIARAEFEKDSEATAMDCSSVCSRTESFSKEMLSSLVLIAEAKGANSFGNPLRIM
jgi:hypothetical protein